MKSISSAMLLLFGLFWPSLSAAEEVDLELVLAMDASGSISHREYILQLEGTAAAFRDPAVQAAIQSGLIGKIAVTVMLWSDAAYPKVNSGWFVLDGRQSAEEFASFVMDFQLNENREISFGGGGTGIGSGVEEALRLLELNSYRGLRNVIDVSGDGIETEFWFSNIVLIKDAKQMAEASNVTINGLPILTRDFPNLDDYYRKNVISGPGAFVETAENFEDFGRAIRRKLLREISSSVSYLEE